VPPCIKEGKGGLRHGIATAGLPFPDSAKAAGASQSISAPWEPAKLSNATQRVSVAVSSQVTNRGDFPNLDDGVANAGSPAAAEAG
jgi:hypothetical protein